METIKITDDLYYAIAQDCAHDGCTLSGSFQIKEWYRLGDVEFELFVRGHIFEHRYDAELNDFVFVRRNPSVAECYISAYNIKNGCKYSEDFDLTRLVSILADKSYVGKETQVRC